MKSVLSLTTLALLLAHSTAEEFSLPKYKVKYENSNIPINVARSFTQLKSDEGSFEIVSIDKENERRKYLCHLPQEKAISPIQKSNSSTSNAGNSTDQELITQANKQITDSFSRSNCVYAPGLNGGYWTIAYCFGDKIIQFHEDLIHFYKTREHKPEYPNSVFVLGRFAGAPVKPVKLQNQARKLKNELSDSEFTIYEDIVDQLSDTGTALSYSSQKFVQHTLVNGGLCDLTQEPRSIEISYKCDPYKHTPEIVELLEISTCKYQLVISVPKLCSIEEFRPNSVEDKVIDISCKGIDLKSVAGFDQVEYKDFYKYEETASVSNLFLASKNFKINLADYHLGPCGSGFYLGQSKTGPLDEEPSWQDKNVLIYNREYKSKRDILSKAGFMFASVLDRKIPSPVFIADNVVSPLSWTDSFIVWYELFDFYGNLILYLRVLRDGKDESNRLDLQIIDPETMVDQDGDLVQMPEFESPNGQYNFEKFSRPVPVQGGDLIDQVTHSTVTITKTLESAETETQIAGPKEDLIEKIAAQLQLQGEHDLQKIYELLNSPEQTETSTTTTAEYGDEL